eukprot:3800778-Ditylum_brightwellii.AAC.1
MVQDLATAGGNPYTEGHLMNIAFDLVFSTDIHNDTCKEWLQVPAARCAWANFKLHFTESHCLLHKLQTSAAQAEYTANNMYADYSQDLAAEVIAQLAEATEADRSTVSNLATTNQMLLDQVANMMSQMLAKDDEIKELQKSIEQLNLTIRAFANTNNLSGGSDKKQGKKKKGK